MCPTPASFLPAKYEEEEVEQDSCNNSWIYSTEEKSILNRGTPRGITFGSSGDMTDGNTTGPATEEVETEMGRTLGRTDDTIGSGSQSKTVMNGKLQLIEKPTGRNKGWGCNRNCPLPSYYYCTV